MLNNNQFHKYSGNVYLPLYKYYSNYKYVEDVIVNNRIHFEAPSEYNDIYDSAFVLKKQDLNYCVNSTKNLCGILREIIPNKYFSIIDACEKSVEKDQFSIWDFIEFASDYDHMINKDELAEAYISSIESGGLIQACNNKITCFSERNDSLLMWSYYGDKHCGVCLEFDIASDPVLKQYCSKVNYSHHFTNSKSSFDGYFIKSSEWEHEQEWRIVRCTEEEYCYTNSLKSIILGAKISKENRNNMIELAKNHKLNIYEAIPEKTEFKLKIIPLCTYDL